MDVALLMARLLLVGVFGVAGLAKLANRAEARQMMIDFSVPSNLATPLGSLLPLAELLVAVALIPTATAWWGGIGALTFLVLFIAGISHNLAHGRTPACRCFGKVYTTRAGWPTLVRNSLLALIAGFIIWQGSQSAGPHLFSGFVYLLTSSFGG